MLDQLNGQAEEQRQSPPPTAPLSPPPKPKLTAAQAALARAQAARARAGASRPVAKPSPDHGTSRTAVPASRSYEPSLVDKVRGVLDGLEYLTFIFLATGPTSSDHAFEWGPTLDAVVRLATDLTSGALPKIRRFHWFRDPQDGLPDEVTREKTIATVQSCLDRLGTRKDIDFALVWYIEGETKAHFDLAGYTFETAFAQIGYFLGEEVKDLVNC